MLYQAYQAQSDLMAPVRAYARTTAAWLNAPAAGFECLARTPAVRHTAAALEMVGRATLSHSRPDFGIRSVRVGGKDVAVSEVAADVTPFCTLLRFHKQHDAEQPRVLLVAPMSGHFPTLLRATVETMLPEHDVYLTDWHNARDIRTRDGRFGFDEYVDHLIRFLEYLRPGAHMVAVCQPCPQALAATAVMSEAGNPCTPRSLTLMAGPVDARINPTSVNDLATSRPIEWFDRNVIDTVPWRFRGRGRRVYPGFVQLSAFLSMNPGRHIQSHFDLFGDIAAGNDKSAGATKEFYDEYFSVSDLTAEFYLETVQWIFQEYRLARGELTWHGNPVNLGAIDKTALLTIEGERDDICAVGQTLAAQDLCTSIPRARKRHHLQAGVGHFGVFSGRRWKTQVYPVVENVILAND